VALNMVRKDKKTETFEQKVNMMGLNLSQQADMLNKMYAGKIHFQAFSTCIEIQVIDESIEMLELPEASTLFFSGIRIPCFSKLYGIKFPKCMPKTSAKELSLNRYERVFAWDDNITDINSIREGLGGPGKLKMIAMQYSDGRKPKIYRFQ